MESQYSIYNDLDIRSESSTSSVENKIDQSLKNQIKILNQVITEQKLRISRLEEENKKLICKEFRSQISLHSDKSSQEQKDSIYKRINELAQTKENQINSLKQQNKNALQKIQNQQTQIQKLKQKIDSLQYELKAQRKKLQEDKYETKESIQIYTIEQQNSQVQKKNKDMQDELKKLNQKICAVQLEKEQIGKKNQKLFQQLLLQQAKGQNLARENRQKMQEIKLIKQWNVEIKTENDKNIKNTYQAVFEQLRKLKVNLSLQQEQEEKQSLSIDEITHQVDKILIIINQSRERNKERVNKQFLQLRESYQIIINKLKTQLSEVRIQQQSQVSLTLEQIQVFIGMFLSGVETRYRLKAKNKIKYFLDEYANV